MLFYNEETEISISDGMLFVIDFCLLFYHEKVR